MCRQYEPIWNKLKSLPPKEAEVKGISIFANSALHKRIIKAVRKEKWKDMGYKLALEDKKATLTYSRTAAIITFYLSFSLTEEDF